MCELKTLSHSRSHCLLFWYFRPLTKSVRTLVLNVTGGGFFYGWFWLCVLIPTAGLVGITPLRLSPTLPSAFNPASSGSHVPSMSRFPSKERFFFPGWMSTRIPCITVKRDNDFYLSPFSALSPNTTDWVAYQEDVYLAPGSEGWKSRCWHQLDIGEGLPAVSWHVEGVTWRDRASVLLRTRDGHRQVPPTWPHGILITSQRSHFQFPLALIWHLQKLRQEDEQSRSSGVT
jgi:hypothetical protein